MTTRTLVPLIVAVAIAALLGGGKPSSSATPEAWIHSTTRQLRSFIDANHDASEIPISTRQAESRDPRSHPRRQSHGRFVRERRLPSTPRSSLPAYHATCLRTYSARTRLTRVWYPTLRRAASLRSSRKTSGSSRIAINWRARSPSGGRPTRRMARSCSPEASGISEKSIFRAAPVRGSLLPAREPRTDDTDRFDIA